MNGIRLVAFDLDGTLVDSAPDLAYCLGKALETRGLAPPSLAEAHRWIGDGVRVLVRRGLESRLGTAPDDKTLDETLGAFQNCYRDHFFVRSTVFPGVAETLAGLAARGMTLGCITNKPKAFADDLLERAGLAVHLAFIHGADSFRAMKPDPLPMTLTARKLGIDPAASMMVGDSINDLKAARGAGFGFIFAAYGYAPADDPELAACASVIHEFTELNQLLS